MWFMAPLSTSSMIRVRHCFNLTIRSVIRDVVQHLIRRCRTSRWSCSVQQFSILKLSLPTTFVFLAILPANVLHSSKLNPYFNLEVTLVPLMHSRTNLLGKWLQEWADLPDITKSKINTNWSLVFLFSTWNNERAKDFDKSDHACSGIASNPWWYLSNG